MKGRKVLSAFLPLAIVAAVLLSVWLSVKFDNPNIVVIAMSVIFGGSFLISIIMIIGIFVRAARSVKAETDPAAEHEKEIAKVNATYGYANYQAMAEQEVKSWMRTARASSHSDRVKSILLLVWLFGTLITGLVLLGASNEGANRALLIAGIVCVACFPLTIIIALVVVSTRQRLSQRIDPNQPPMNGTVVSCTVSSQTSVGSHTKRIGTTTYRVVVEVSGGDQLVAFTKRPYNAGDTVTVQPSRTRGLVAVLDTAQ